MSKPTGKPTHPPRHARGWALYTPTGWIFTESVRRSRRDVIDYANNDAALTWNWQKYRKKGFFIAKVEIVPAGRAALEDATRGRGE